MLQLGLRFRIERSFHLVMGAFHEQLPEGWSSVEKERTVYQFRCPWGELCGKQDKLLYESQNKDTVLDSAALHLLNEAVHEDFKELKIARDTAVEGVTKRNKKVTVYYDEKGDEQTEPPFPKAKKRPTPPAKSPTEGEREKQRVQSRREYYQNPNQNQKERDYRRQDTEVIGARRSKDRKASSSRDQYDDGNRSRTSRARLRSRSHTHSCSRDSSNNQISTTGKAASSARLWTGREQARQKFQIRSGPREHEVIIGRVELDQIGDCIQRAADGTSTCVKLIREFCKAAEASFEAERHCLNSSRDALQRFTRA